MKQLDFSPAPASRASPPEKNFARHKFGNNCTAKIFSHLIIFRPEFAQRQVVAAVDAPRRADKVIDWSPNVRRA